MPDLSCSFVHTSILIMTPCSSFSGVGLHVVPQTEDSLVVARVEDELRRKVLRCPTHGEGLGVYLGFSLDDTSERDLLRKAEINQPRVTLSVHHDVFGLFIGREKTKRDPGNVPKEDEGNKYTDWVRKELLSMVPTAPHTSVC